MTDSPLFFSTLENKRIIVAPMDWGLGHASRIACAIRILMKNNYVMVVCGHSAYEFLKQEIPDVDIIEIDDWRIRYPKRKISIFTILGWIPVVIRNSIHEHRIVKKIIKQQNINCIVSDNRYGLIFKGLECYIVTHQIYVKMPKGLALLETLSGWIFKKYLSIFDKVLIPDFASGEGLTGSLASERNLPENKFIRIGILSRYIGKSDKNHCRKYDIMVLISGQENQRTIFENLLISALKGSDKRIIFVRGVSDNSPHLQNTENIEFWNMLSGDRLLDAILSSELIICRAGYSTLCDMVALRKRAIIIPTPGQTEQEYLSERLDGKFGFSGIRQGQMDNGQWTIDNGQMDNGQWSNGQWIMDN